MRKDYSVACGYNPVILGLTMRAVLTSIMAVLVVAALFLGIVLYLYDFAWLEILKAIGVLRSAPPE